MEELANIPALLLAPDGVTELRRLSAIMVMRVACKVELVPGKSRTFKLESGQERKPQGGLNSVKLAS